MTIQSFTWGLLFVFTFPIFFQKEAQRKQNSIIFVLFVGEVELQI